MKKLLAIALIAVYPLFGVVKSDNARLLAHLKNIRQGMEYKEYRTGRLEDLRNEPQEFAQECILAWRLYAEFYQKSKFLQKIMNEMANAEYKAICNNIGEEFWYIDNQYWVSPACETLKKPAVYREGAPWGYHFHVEITDEVKQELFEIFLPIFTKLVVGKNEIFGEKITDEMIYQTFEGILDTSIWYPESLRENWPLLKLVDAKIAEFERTV